MMMRATHSIRTLATHLGRAPSTVSREIARHMVDPLKGYAAGLAGYRARLTRHRPRQRPKAASRREALRGGGLPAAQVLVTGTDSSHT